MYKCADGTLCPIPIRRRPLVTALFHEHVFKVLNVIPVPWEEISRIVNLFIELKAVKEQRTPSVP